MAVSRGLLGPWAWVGALAALVGLLLARWGAVGAYLFDFATFVAALVFLARIPREAVGSVDAPGERPHLLADLRDRLRIELAYTHMLNLDRTKTHSQLTAWGSLISHFAYTTSLAGAGSRTAQCGVLAQWLKADANKVLEGSFRAASVLAKS